MEQENNIVMPQAVSNLKKIQDIKLRIRMYTATKS